MNFFNYKFFIGILVSLVFSYISFKKFNFSDLSILINEINLFYIFIAVIILLFSVFLRALRWKLLFKTDQIKTRFLFDIELIGYFGNNILPLRMGELLRSLLVSKQYKFSNSYVFGTIILERFLDMLGLILIVITLVLLDFKLLFEYIFKYKYIYILILVPFILAISFFKGRKAVSSKNKLIEVFNSLINGFSSLNRKNIIYIFIYTVFIWMIYAIEVYIIQYSLNINLSINQCMFLLILSTIALSIPSAPANIGTFEFSIIYGMSIIGINTYSAEFAVLLHLLTFIPYTVIGGLLLMYNYLYVFNEK